MSGINKNFEILNQPGSKMLKFRDHIFKALWIQHLHFTLFGNCFRVLYKDIKSGMYLTDLVYPENLWYYTVGAHYKNNHAVSQIPSQGERIDMTVTSTGNNRIKKVGQAISDAKARIAMSSNMKKTNQVE